MPRMLPTYFRTFFKLNMLVMFHNQLFAVESFLSVFLTLFITLLVYSSWEVGKLRCFSWIKERFGGPNVRFCVIGDGTEECEAAQAMRWPFIKIDLRPSSPCRFPGLTMKVVQSYTDVMYGSPDVEVEETEEF